MATEMDGAKREVTNKILKLKVLMRCLKPVPHEETVSPGYVLSQIEWVKQVHREVVDSINELLRDFGRRLEFSEIGNYAEKLTEIKQNVETYVRSKTRVTLARVEARVEHKHAATITDDQSREETNVAEEQMTRKWKEDGDIEENVDLHKDPTEPGSMHGKGYNVELSAVSKVSGTGVDKVKEPKRAVDTEVTPVTTVSDGKIEVQVGKPFGALGKGKETRTDFVVIEDSNNVDEEKKDSKSVDKAKASTEKIVEEVRELDRDVEQKLVPRPAFNFGNQEVCIQDEKGFLEGQKIVHGEMPNDDSLGENRCTEPVPVLKNDLECVYKVADKIVLSEVPKLEDVLEVENGPAECVKKSSENLTCADIDVSDVVSVDAHVHFGCVIKETVENITKPPVSVLQDKSYVDKLDTSSARETVDLKGTLNDYEETFIELTSVPPTRNFVDYDKNSPTFLGAQLEKEKPRFGGKDDKEDLLILETIKEEAPVCNKTESDRHSKLVKVLHGQAKKVPEATNGPGYLKTRREVIYIMFSELLKRKFMLIPKLIVHRWHGSKYMYLLTVVVKTVDWQSIMADVEKLLADLEEEESAPDANVPVDANFSVDANIPLYKMSHTGAGLRYRLTTTGGYDRVHCGSGARTVVTLKIS